MHFFRQFKDHNSGKENENYKNDPIFSSTFSALPACNIHFWIWKYLKLFSISFVWSILICKIPQFFAKSYWFGQLIILFQKVDTLRLLKIYIMFCLTAGAKYPFFRLQLMDYIGGWRKFHAEPVCFFITFLVAKNSFQKPFWLVLLSVYYWTILICLAAV